MELNGSDQIHIRDLRIRCILGVHPHERSSRREVIINYTLYYNRPKAAGNDDISQAIDYEVVTGGLVERVESSNYELIETLAEFVADYLLDVPGVLACRITVDKPGVPEKARSAAIEIYRKKRL